MPKPKPYLCKVCGRSVVELQTVATNVSLVVDTDSWVGLDLKGNAIEGGRYYRKSLKHKVHKCPPPRQKANEPTERMKGMLRENPPSQ